MTPQEKQQFEELKNTVDKLVNNHNSLYNSSTIPHDIDQALRTRFGITNQSIATTTKSATSENQVVDESGVASYSVMGIPDGFIKLSLNGTIYNLPYFS